VNELIVDTVSVLDVEIISMTPPWVSANMSSAPSWMVTYSETTSDRLAKVPKRSGPYLLMISIGVPSNEVLAFFVNIMFS
jgi:hypothetical protein